MGAFLVHTSYINHSAEKLNERMFSSATWITKQIHMLHDKLSANSIGFQEKHGESVTIIVLISLVR